mmetsp:Transcript_53941/g.161450  ORF Transcript_53941/g.161450 Transcript_53941/m.161450 type:complete len:218 (-) Transcript_53941:290-943(-)
MRLARPSRRLFAGESTDRKSSLLPKLRPATTVTKRPRRQYKASSRRKNSDWITSIWYSCTPHPSRYPLPADGREMMPPHAVNRRGSRCLPYVNRVSLGMRASPTLACLTCKNSKTSELPSRTIKSNTTPSCRNTSTKHSNTATNTTLPSRRTSRWAGILPTRIRPCGTKYWDDSRRSTRGAFHRSCCDGRFKGGVRLFPERAIRSTCRKIWMCMVSS